MATNISAITVTATQVYSTQVDATRVYANTFGGLGGGGALIVADKILLGGWLIEAEASGIFVTTPGGVKTKMELIDFRETPVPDTPRLNLPPQEPTPSTALPGGPSDTTVDV